MLPRILAILATSLTTAAGVQAASPAPVPAAVPGATLQAGIDISRLQRVDALVQAAIADKKLPGAVALVGRGDAVVWKKTWGHRSIEPAAEPMTLDTVFDLASLTKVVATTTSVMILVEEGRVRLNDRVAEFIPEFARYGKEGITVRHLLTHVSGLRPDLDLADEWTGYDTAIARAVEEVPYARPGERVIYSDINFFLLGEIVKRVSGEALDVFARRRIFEPLGMRETTFNPPASLLPRIAPTEKCTPYGWPCEGPGMSMLRGVVHDPTARRMGGVAGHAGLFSTAADLALFCRMVLRGGSLGTTRVLSPLTVLKMTTPATPPTLPHTRGLGWDMDSSYSSNRGELLPLGSFGHTGWTGTSIWIDPATRLFVIFLSNRVHPDGKGDVTPLRAKFATAVAAALVDAPSAPRSLAWTGRDMGPSGTAPRAHNSAVLTGLDKLRAEGFAALKGRRVGLVTNHTGRARDGASVIDLLHSASGVSLVALFSPEHGIRGALDDKVPSGRDEKTGLVIHSLYGETQRPTDEMLRGIDTLVIDIQDIGARFYTYTTTMAYVLEEAAKRRIAVVVLDRPNPIGGFQIEGPTIDESARGFTAYFPMPIRHGLTMGELARLFNAENKIGADLTVVPLQGWRRDAWYDETGLPWINPSPNMRNMTEAVLYPGIGAIEATNISVGRGTDTPFEQVGAPWVDAVRLADHLNERQLPGIRFYPVSFTPTSSKHAGQQCQGVYMLVTNREALRPVRVGLEVAAALWRLHGSAFKIDDAARLLGSREALERIKAADDPVNIAAGWTPAEAKWRLLRAKHLLYPEPR
jgi:uncharacterized protein YbbC (DUF1343 family)/CubicO group peptidase (beta-lactamase class C family)